MMLVIVFGETTIQLKLGMFVLGLFCSPRAKGMLSSEAAAQGRAAPASPLPTCQCAPLVATSR